VVFVFGDLVCYVWRVFVVHCVVQDWKGEVVDFEEYDFGDVGLFCWVLVVCDLLGDVYCVFVVVVCVDDDLEVEVYCGDYE